MSLGLTLGMSSGMVSGMDAGGKVRENRLRRVAARRMMRLQKSRRRDPRAFDFGTYRLIDTRTESVVIPDPASESHGATLDDVEAWLDRPGSTT